MSMDLTQLESWLFDPTIGKIVATILGVLIIQGLSSLLQRSFGRRIRDTGARYQVRKFITFAGYLGIVIMITLVFSDRLSSLTVALGVAGAGIAFALQEVIASIAGWFAISFANFYRVGDRVQLGGIKGDVIDVAILRTTLMEIGEWVKGDQYSGRIVRIANSFVFKEPVFNYSGDFPFVWDEIAVPIKYGSDHRLAREVLGKVVDEEIGEYGRRAAESWRAMIKKYLVEEASVKPVILLALNDNWMEYTVRYVVDYKNRRSTKDQLYSRLLDEFANTDGRVAIASTTIQLVELPPLNIRLAADSFPPISPAN
jgi:small-conductance mechanosensitive channel